MRALQSLKQRLESFRDKLPSAQSRSDAAWDLSLSHPGLNWTVDECLIIDSHRQQKKLCAAQVEGLGDTYQTFVIDCNLDTNEILVDTFFPELPLATLYTQQTARLRLVTEKSVLCLRIQILHEELVGKDFALRARICDKLLSSDRRLHPRIEFERDSGPEISLTSPLGSGIKGRVVNLSCGGLLMNSCSHTEPRFYTPRGECKIQLTSQHRLSLPVNIKNIRRLKRMKHQILATLLFDQIGSDQEDKIRAFIRAIEDARKHLIASP